MSTAWEDTIVGSAEWLESLSRDERLKLVEVFAGYGDRARPPVDASALLHLRWLVAEVKRLEALLGSGGAE